MRWWNYRSNGRSVYRPVINDSDTKEFPNKISGTSLWLKNTSPYPLLRLELLLSFSFAEVLDYGIEIHIKGSSGSYRGRAYDGVPKIANVIDGANYLVTIGLARTRASLPNRIGPGTKTEQKRYPDGIAVRSWEDIFVFVAAHEARHIWQFKARRIAGNQPISEVDADRYAIKKLSEWRIINGWEPIIPER